MNPAITAARAAAVKVFDAQDAEAAADSWGLLPEQRRELAKRAKALRKEANRAKEDFHKRYPEHWYLLQDAIQRSTAMSEPARPSWAVAP